MAKTKIHAEVIADSLNTATGDRLLTFRVVFPRFVLAEFNTHRALSRNFSSSRAVPAKKIRARIIADPVIPVSFGRNQSGMQAKEELQGWRRAIALRVWLWARFPACAFHWIGEKVGLHKQLINRVVEPWMWAEGVVSSTEWRNFFALRNHADAQPEIAELARCMKAAMDASTPAILNPGEWHLSFVTDTESMQAMEGGRLAIYEKSANKVGIEDIKKVSAARCARVSYYLRDGQRSPLEKDLELCDRLAGSSPKHLSPFEHVAQALPTRERCGNFVGWKQFRKEFEDESNGDYQA